MGVGGSWRAPQSKLPARPGLGEEGGRTALGSSSFWMEIHPKSFPHTWGVLPTLFSQDAKC